jgi:ABC-type sugar transport system ATPase subunit
MDNNNIVEFKNISKFFGGVHALKNVSFSISRGEVHAIIGENGAGKSTLMNILSGLYLPDKGDVLIDKEKIKLANTRIAKGKGIATVYQELKLCPNLNVIENIFLGREHHRCGMLNWKKMNVEVFNRLKMIGLEIDPLEKVSNLTPAQMQLVEIAKAVFIRSKIIILDEPTSSLTIKETEKLFNIIEKLKEENVTIVFISHRMEEIFRISDRITVMKNGEYLGTFLKEDVTPNEIVTLIAGRELASNESKIGENSERQANCVSREAMLEVINLKSGRKLNNISFRLYKGEILGFYGLEGAGRTELMETIYGLRKCDGGEILINGKEMKIKNPRSAINNGITMLPEDRKNVGLFMNFDIKNNIASINEDKITRLKIMRNSVIKLITQGYIEKLSIKSFGENQMVRTLSGGNQQKVVISKCLSVEPNILILDEPTRGVDVGAKAEIYRILRQLRDEKNLSIIIVSSEIREIITECERVLVMRNGRIAGELQKESINSDSILQLAFNG